MEGTGCSSGGGKGRGREGEKISLRSSLCMLEKGRGEAGYGEEKEREGGEEGRGGGSEGAKR